MIGNAISTPTARRFYDWLGTRHDWGASFEREAKLRALTLLDVSPGQQVLNVGLGTGKEQVILQRQVDPGGHTYGIDISRVMLNLAAERVPATRLCEATAQKLPFAARSFDRLLATYVLDLLPSSWIPNIVDRFWHILKPGGRMALVTLTEGVDAPSKAVIAAWKTIYQLHPLACGGCRPVLLESLPEAAGFYPVAHEIVVQNGVPSAIVIAQRPPIN